MRLYPNYISLFPSFIFKYPSTIIRSECAQGLKFTSLQLYINDIKVVFWTSGNVDTKRYKNTEINAFV